MNLPMANTKVHSPVQATPGYLSRSALPRSQHGTTDTAAACAHAAPGPCQAAFCVAGKLAVTAADLQRGGVRWGPRPGSRSACLQAKQCVCASWIYGGGAR